MEISALHNRIVRTVEIDRQVSRDGSVAGATATTASITLSGPNAVETRSVRNGLCTGATAVRLRVGTGTTKDRVYDVHSNPPSVKNYTKEQVLLVPNYSTTTSFRI